MLNIDTTAVIEWLLMCCAISILFVIFTFGTRIVWGGLTGKFDPLDLVLGKNGRISDEKIWTHVGKGLLVFAMIKDASDGHPDWNLQLALFVALAAHEVVIRWMANREGLMQLPGKTVTTSTKVSTLEKTLDDQPKPPTGGNP